MRRIFLFATCSVLSFLYVSVISNLPASYWLHYTQKPFIYRALIPLLGVTPTGILVVVSLSAMFLSLTVIYIYEKYWEKSIWNDSFFIYSFATIVLILTRYSNYYDFASAFFFLIILILWTEKKYGILVPVYFFACLNRETIILIIPVLFLIRRRWDIVLYILEYILVRLMLSYAYSGASGQAFYIQPMLNILLHVKYYWVSIPMILAGWGTYLLFAWNSPLLKREVAIFGILLVPIFFMVYMIVGYAFEIRVFAEVLPILFFGAFMKGAK